MWEILESFGRLPPKSIQQQFPSATQEYRNEQGGGGALQGDPFRREQQFLVLVTAETGSYRGYWYCHERWATESTQITHDHQHLLPNLCSVFPQEIVPALWTYPSPFLQSAEPGNSQ